MGFLVKLWNKLKGAVPATSENLTLNLHSQPKSEETNQPPGYCICILRESKISRVSCRQIEQAIQLREDRRILKDISFAVNIPATTLSRLLKYGPNSCQCCSDSRREWYAKRIQQICKA